MIHDHERTFDRLERIRQARDHARTARRVVHRAIDGALADGHIHGELIDAAADLDSVVIHLERALRLTDPASAGVLARRADEDRTLAGS